MRIIIIYFLKKTKTETFKLFEVRRAQSPYRNNMSHINECGCNHHHARTTRITVAFSVVCPNNHAITRKRIIYILVKYMLYLPTRSTNDVGCAVGEGFEYEMYIIIATRTFAMCNVLLNYIHIIILV